MGGCLSTPKADEEPAPQKKPPPKATPPAPPTQGSPAPPPPAEPPAQKPALPTDVPVTAVTPPATLHAAAQNSHAEEQAKAPASLRPSQLAQPLRAPLVSAPLAQATPAPLPAPPAEPAAPPAEALPATVLTTQPADLPPVVSAVALNGTVEAVESPATEAAVSEAQQDAAAAAADPAPVAVSAPTQAAAPAGGDARANHTAEAVNASATVVAAATAPARGTRTGGSAPVAEGREEEEDEEEEEEDEDEGEEGLDYIELQEYSFQELVDASNDFQEDAVLGEGGFGKVYKGLVLDRFPRGGGPPVQAAVAIKKLNPAGYQSKVEWMREILILGKLNHPNLVRLIGYCADLEEMLLVYEFVPRGSLDYHLWPGPNSSTPPLPWQARLRIAHDAACGLAYLHANNFIHRDFKAPNILLDEDYSSKLTDFGLAKDGPDAGQTHVSTQIMGTMGYLDPRYAETGQLTVKSDVYAYGVVLLELLTGKKAMGISPTGKPKTLTSWARPYLNRPRPDLESLVDPNMMDPYPEKVARTLAISAKHCIHDDTNMRPMMTDIVDTLRPLNMAINGPRR